MFKRQLVLPSDPTRSFFLWGPRQTGKSSLLRATYPSAIWVDLLESPVYRELTLNPERLRERLAALPKELVVIDEVQKVPDLLDEIHWLIERQKRTFVLCGSSARKLKRGHANLLGGRAERRELHGLTWMEVRGSVRFEDFLQRGFLPPAVQSPDPQAFFDAYVGDYLKEEIAAEGLVRNLPAFGSFLELAALSDTEQVNLSNFAREVGVSHATVQSYFQVLEDTLLGEWLPAYRKRPKRRISTSPKFYFFDVGLVNWLTRRRSLATGTPEFGKVFEHWVQHELRAYNAYGRRYAKLSYWRLSTGTEVDFIINDMECAIEAKGTARIRSDAMSGLRELQSEHKHIKRKLVVSLISNPLRTEDGIEMIGPDAFTDLLWTGKLF